MSLAPLSLVLTGFPIWLRTHVARDMTQRMCSHLKQLARACSTILS